MVEIGDPELEEIRMGSLKWVSTGGSPLIIIPVEAAEHWRGTETTVPSAGDAEAIWEAIREHSDYGRACGVDDYLGVLEVGSRKCLVLGDEPTHTAFLPIENGGIIVRWIHAEHEEDVLRAVQVVPENVWARTQHRIHVNGGGLLLFDSAYPGDELPSTYTGEIIPWLRIVIPKGNYEIDTADYHPNDGTRLILHRLRLK
jgi:hypothetical protein